MKVRREVGTVVILLLGIAIMYACTTPTPEDQTVIQEVVVTATPEEGVESEPLLVGVQAPLSGDAAQYGYWLQRGIELAAREINAVGGINGRQIEFLYGDDRCNAADAAMVAHRFAANQDIEVIIGPVCSNAALATGSIYEKAKLTHITTGATNPVVTQQGWKYQFRTQPHDGLGGPQMARLAIERLGKTKVAIIYGSEDYSVGLLESIEPAIREIGGEVVALETFTPGDRDFSPQLTRISEADPEVLFYLGHYTEGGLIAAQRVGAGLGDIPYIVPDGCQQQGFIDLGGEGAEGTLLIVYYDASDPSPVNQDFVVAYMESYADEVPVDQGPYGYWSIYLLKQAFEAGANSDNLNEVLHTLEFMSATGLSRFDETGDLDAGVLEMPVITIQDGQFVTWTPEG